MGGSVRFTLMEIIVTIIVAAIVGAMLIPFLGRALSSTVDPLVRAGRCYDLRSVAERINVDYQDNYRGDLAGLKTKIGAEGALMDNSYGRYRVIHSRYIKFVSGSEQTAQGGDPQDLLKITIKRRDASDEALPITMLFPEHS